MYKVRGADYQEYGPAPAEVLRQWIAEGRVNAQSLVLPEGETRWRPIGELPEFAPVLAGAAAAPGAPGPISVPRTPRTNGLAVASLVLGLFSVTFGICCCLGLPTSVVGLVCSIVSLNQIGKDPEYERGRGVAIAGLVLTLLSLALTMSLRFLGFGGSLWEFFDRVQKL
jgi:hypothetical protein